MAKKKAKTGKDNAVVRYLRDTRAELRKVHWPTRQEAWNLTRVVMAVTISMAVLLGTLDYLFAQTLRGIITGSAIAIGALIACVVVGAVVAIVLARQTAR